MLLLPIGLGKEAAANTYSACCLQPLEAVSPVLLNPHFNPKKPVTIEILNKVSNLCWMIPL